MSRNESFHPKATFKSYIGMNSNGDNNINDDVS